MFAAMKQKLVSRSDFSKLCGVSAAATTKACKSVLAPAIVGRRLDMAHPAAVEYMAKHDAAPANDPPKKAAKKKAPPPPPVVKGRAAENNNKKSVALADLNNRVENETTLHEIPDDIKAFADMTLRELIGRYGTETAFKDWLSATKQIEDINEKRLKNATTRGQLVSRDLVQRNIIEPIDAAHKKMLSDGSKTMARRVAAMIQSGRPVEDCEKFIKDTISSFIKPMKAKVTRSIKNI